jgi:hypothetical protein
LKFEEKNIEGSEDIYGEDGREEKSADSCMCMTEKETDSVINKLETFGQVLGLHQSSGILNVACTGCNVHVVGQYGCGSSSVCHRPTEAEVTDLNMAVCVQQQV